MDNFYIPKKISIELTDKCNLSCVHCFREAGHEKNKTYIANNTISSIIEKCYKSQVKHISYTGGEPFYTDEIFNIVEKTAYYKIPFSISTNGYRRLYKYTDLFEKSKPKSFQVSLDGDESTHNLIRNNANAYKRLCEFLLWAKELNIKRKVQFTAMPQNINTISFLTEFVEKYSIDSVHIAIALPVGRFKNENTLSYNQLLLVNEMKENLKAVNKITVSSTLFGKYQLLNYIENCKKNINYFITPVIKQTGYLHPFWDLDEMWNFQNIAEQELFFNENILNASYAVIKKAIIESLIILERQKLLDFNSVLYNCYKKGGCML